MTHTTKMTDFISLADLSPAQLWHLLEQARDLKEEWRSGGSAPRLQGRVLGMIFQKPSLRTRVSFDVAMLQLGGHALYLSPNEIQLGVRESVADVARVTSRYVDGIMARVFDHAHILELAAHSSVPVINGLSDFNHPCQGLADLFTIFEHYGELAGLKLAYVGDGNNVTHSLLFGGALTGMHVAVAAPQGFEPDAAVVAQARERGEVANSQITVTHEPAEAVADADVIYTDVWASMGQEQERAKRLAVFPSYQVNQALVESAKANVVVMHCLPAHRGEEITDEVIDGPHSIVFDQAENRLHAQKAILVELMARNSNQ
ncbi:MAG: ornithine carbamoyltransferase [Anaerolineae bacterium]